MNILMKTIVGAGVHMSNRWTRFAMRCTLTPLTPKIWLALAFTSMISAPAPAQDYRKNFTECAKENGLQATATRKIQDGRTLTRWRSNGQAQQMAFYDCLSRKARLAPQPSGNHVPQARHAAGHDHIRPLRDRRDTANDQLPDEGQQPASR